eukprot:TRINITY_DN34848_c0_g1_i1.p1 TRINITY_DN34848_c0_g1~~TRINITY_DN34848_c0_g1_i1.p1  ORF type:complete len:724 (-),score=152.78 TRINITY_DN34848_c0_g1_i1:27-2084(-)
MEAAPGTGVKSVTTGGTSTASSAPAASTVQAKHGAVAGVAALIEVLQERVASENQAAIRNLVPALEKARAYRGRGGEVVRQAACRLLGCVASAESWAFKDATAVRYLQTVDECARHATDLIQVLAADALGVLSRIRLNPELCNKCIDNYLSGLKKVDETISARRGYCLCLGSMPPSKLGDRRGEVLAALCKEAQGLELPSCADQEDPTTRQYAVLALGRLCLATAVSNDELSAVVVALKACMHDYAADRRGDVGSWVREVAMEVAAALLDVQRREPIDDQPQLPDATASTQLVALMLQQAVEKIDRLRERSFGLLRTVLCTSETLLPRGKSLQLAYRRVCHSEAYDAIAISEEAGTASPANTPRGSWPPAHIDHLVSALGQPLAPAPTGENLDCFAASSSTKADRHGFVFDALVPLLAHEEYRPALVMGLVVSVGGLTEHTAKDAKRALLRHLNNRDGAANEVCNELLNTFDCAGVRDSEPEARRLLAPVLNTVGILLAQEAVPQEFARPFYDKAMRAVKTSRDIGRLRAAIAVFIGLLKWPGMVRRKSMSMLLQFLGTSFPTVRQGTAQALYIRLLEEEGDFDVSDGDEATAAFVPPPRAEAEVDGRPGVVAASALAEVLELLSVTPWGTDNDEALTSALREVYGKLHFDIPTGGRSILAPKKPKEDVMPRAAQYADLVRDNHF